MKKLIVVGIIALFVGASILPSTMGTIEKNTTFTPASSTSYIQDLIDNASDGDTIYIPSGTYYENIVINKSISLIGEDKNTTIIDGFGNGHTVYYVVYVSANNVTVSGFTIQDSGNSLTLGILIRSNYNTISKNIINAISRYGIRLIESHCNIITNNIILKNDIGISLTFSGNNALTGNSILNSHEYAIYLSYACSNNIISYNNISNNDILGINLIKSNINTIKENNFINNKRDAYFKHSFLNQWKQNFWNGPKMNPKLIIGKILIYRELGFKWFNFDWRPAMKPYDI
jgi:nitrous oxidase accessory protein